MNTPDFLRAYLETIIDLRPTLAVLATRLPWAEIEEALASLFARKGRPGQRVAGEDLFGPTEGERDISCTNASKVLSNGQFASMRSRSRRCEPNVASGSITRDDE